MHVSGKTRMFLEKHACSWENTHVPWKNMHVSGKTRMFQTRVIEGIWVNTICDNFKGAQNVNKQQKPGLILAFAKVVYFEC